MSATFNRAKCGRELRIERLENRRVLALSLDISFDGDGFLTTDFGFGTDTAEAVGIQRFGGNDERIVVGGRATNFNGNDDFAVARYRSDGMLDRDFGINGGLTQDFFGSNETIFDVTVQPADNKIVAAGASFFTNAQGNQEAAFAIVRYNADGKSVDTTFGNDLNVAGTSFVQFFTGQNLFGQVATNIARAVAVQPDGKILVAGDTLNLNTGNSDFALARLNADGTLDTSFGFQGTIFVDGAGGFDQAEDIVLQPDGKIIVAGWGQNGVRGEDMFLLRFTADGFLDTSFFGNGVTFIGFIDGNNNNFSGGNDRLFGVDVQPDGQIVAAGGVFRQGTNLDFAVLRLDANGVLDPTFGNNNGFAVTDFGGGDDFANAVNVLDDGSILATGQAFYFGDFDVALAAYNSNGAPDTTRLPGDLNADPPNPAGTLSTIVGSQDDIGLGTFLQSDGSVLVVGRAFYQTNDDFMIAKYSEPRNSAPTMDPNTMTVIDPNVDTDGDGLFDVWEINGLDINADGVIDLDLPGLGADPNHKDLFVEIDAMVGRAPLPNSLSDVVTAFRNAPVNNPDGVTGITLHFLQDEFDIPFVERFANLDANFFPIGANAIYDSNFGTDADRASPNRDNIIAAKKRVFRYGLFANLYGSSSSSGVARGGFPGDMFIVTLGGNPSTDSEPGTIMHEFGHTIGLGHGGATAPGAPDHKNCKPNYTSIMSYSYQFRSSRALGAILPNGGFCPQEGPFDQNGELIFFDNRPTWQLDYEPDDWKNIKYSFFRTTSLTAGLSTQDETIRTVEELANPSTPDIPTGNTAALDVTGSGDPKALRDGILIIRFMFGQPPANLEGTQLIPDNATRKTGEEISQYLTDAGLALDVNGDQRIDALRDGILIVRYLFGQPDANLQGAQLITDDSTRRTGAAIREYLDQLMPAAAEGESFPEAESIVRTLLNPSDVNGDGTVSTRDALNVINELHRNGRTQILAWSKFDANHDGHVTARDALYVINRLVEQPALSLVVSSIHDVVDAALSDADELIDLWRDLGEPASLGELSSKITDVVGSEEFDVALASLKTSVDLESFDTAEFEDLIESLVTGRWIDHATVTDI